MLAKREGKISAMKLVGAHGCKWLSLSLAGVFFGLLPLPTQALPDLAIAAVKIVTPSIDYRRRIFSTGDCAYEEGCILAAGSRKLLLLDVGIRNLGTTDLVIGDPQRPERGYPANLFVWSDCHWHYHLKGLATYRVLTLDGRQVAKTYKQGFCLRDDRPKSKNVGGAKYTCDYQGLSAGWMDVYDKTLDCQWVDITDVRPGVYNLEITINPQHIFPESNYLNNRVIIRITVPKTKTVPWW